MEDRGGSFDISACHHWEGFYLLLHVVLLNAKGLLDGAPIQHNQWPSLRVGNQQRPNYHLMEVKYLSNRYRIWFFFLNILYILFFLYIYEYFIIVSICTLIDFDSLGFVELLRVRGSPRGWMREIDSYAGEYNIVAVRYSGSLVFDKTVWCTIYGKLIVWYTCWFVSCTACSSQCLLWRPLCHRV